MPGVPSYTSFANAITASTVDLDGNFTNVAALLKSVNNYTPYGVDAGAVNAFSVTFDVSLTWTLQAGAGVIFKALNANTGAATLTVNGGTTTALTNPDGSALSSGQISAGSMVHAIYSGTAFVLVGATAPTPTTFEGAKQTNAIMNGCFNLWQRGLSFGSVASNTAICDRFRYIKTGTMVHNVTAAVSVPTVAQCGRFLRYSLQLALSVADAAIGAGDYCAIIHRIEGAAFRPYAQRACVLSFWVSASKTGTYCVGFTNQANDRSFVAEYTINVSNTWEKKTILLAASPTAGTWDYSILLGLQVSWALAAGSAFQIAAGAWTATGVGALATSNQTNGVDAGSFNFYLADVQLQAGSTPTEIQDVSPDIEEFLCQRYYENSFASVAYVNSPPASAGGTSNASLSVQVVGASTLQPSAIPVRYRNQKRTNGAGINLYNPGAAGTEVRNISTGTDCTGTAIFAGSAGYDGFLVSCTTPVGSAIGQVLGVSWAADNEL